MILKTMDKATIYVTDEEAAQIFKAMARGDKAIVVRGNYINASGIGGIYKDDALPEPTEGRLHDGTRVVKRFGKWEDAQNPHVRLDPGYYPEIATDTVMSERDWQSGKLLAKVDVRPHEHLPNPEGVCSLCSVTITL